MSSIFGGGSSKPKPKPVEQKKQVPRETQRIVDGAEGERKRETRRRIPAGRKSTFYAGIEKALKQRLGQ